MINFNDKLVIRNALIDRWWIWISSECICRMKYLNLLNFIIFFAFICFWVPLKLFNSCNKSTSPYTAEWMNEVFALTSSQVVVLIAGFPGAKAGALGCGGVQDPRRVEHDHLLQLGVVIHGGVREAQVVWDLQSRKELRLGCSHLSLSLCLSVECVWLALTDQQVAPLGREQWRCWVASSFSLSLSLSLADPPHCVCVFVQKGKKIHFFQLKNRWLRVSF